MAGVAVLLGMGLVASPADAQTTDKTAKKKRIGCSTPELITAINTANTVRTSTINLSANCTYDLAVAAEVGTRGGDGLPIINENITLVGSNTVIRRAPGAPTQFRVAEVNCGGSLVLRGVTISNGDSGAQTGGGILNARGTLTLIGSTVTGNTGDNGAGISNDRGTAIVQASTVSYNTTGSGGGGAGIYNDGTLVVYGGVVTGNAASTSGGGIHNEQGGTANLTYSVVNNNLAGTNGGGVFNGPESSLVVTGSLVSVNGAGNGNGGGAYNGGRISVTSSRFYGNMADSGDGGGVRNAAGAGSLLTMDLSRVDYNRASAGGGIDNTGNVAGQVYLRRTVVNRNTPNNCTPLGTIVGCSG